jgi:large subunit ribosomal protein L3e
MGHRKFHAPRHGHLGFLPRKRTTKHRGKMRSFPQDDKANAPHLTAFMGYKAGMTHVLRLVNRPGSQLHNKEVVEAVTIVEMPPMTAIGIVGYVETPQGLRSLTTVWAETIDAEARRRWYKNWYKSKQKAFSKHAKARAESSEDFEKELQRICDFCSVVRVVAHTHVPEGLRQKKAHVFEIQVNGGSIEDKVAYAKDLLEKQITVDTVFAQDERVDIIGASKGHGYEGVTARYGVKRLPRKTHRGLRKVACIGAWHPSRVRFQVARSGQRGYHHRTEVGKQIYRIGKKVAEGEVDTTASTEQDLTAKGITPLGGFTRYGVVRHDWVMIKGGVVGSQKRPITLRKACRPFSGHIEPANLKFIDTSSKFGHGRHQTAEEKARFYGRTSSA